jgi:hypothetical protein
MQFIKLAAELDQMGISEVEFNEFSPYAMPAASLAVSAV